MIGFYHYLYSIKIWGNVCKTMGKQIVIKTKLNQLRPFLQLSSISPAIPLSIGTAVLPRRCSDFPYVIPLGLVYR